MARKLAIIALVALSAGLALLPGRPAAASSPDRVDRARSGLPTSLRRVVQPAGAPSIRPSAPVEKSARISARSTGSKISSVQSDGKIVAVGTTQHPTTFDTRFALARYAGDGSLDTSFGVGGKVTTGFGGTSNLAFAVAVQGDGKLIAAGVAGGGPTGADIALARYNADGSLDASFGAGGKVVTDFALTHEAAYGLATQPDGKLVVVGSIRPFGPYATNLPDFALARYNPNGSLDTSFGGDGKVSTAFTAGWGDQGFGIALAPGGKIVRGRLGDSRRRVRSWRHRRCALQRRRQSRRELRRRWQDRQRAQ